MARFELRGPHATTLLRSQALFGVSHQHSLTDALDTWKFITQKARRADLLPRGMAISLETIHPLRTSVENPNVLQPFDITGANDDLNDDVDDTDEPLFSYDGDHTQLLQIPDGIALSRELWTRKTWLPSETRDADDMVIDDDDNNVDNDDEMESSVDQKQRRRETRKAVKQLRKTRRINYIQDSIHSVMLVQRNDSSAVSSTPSYSGDRRAVGYGAGWDFICFRHVACHFFPKFAKSKNVLTIPLSDRDRLCNTEQCISSFPQDYPKSRAFLEYHRNMHYARYPKQRKSKKPMHLEHQHKSKFEPTAEQMQIQPKVALHADPSLVVMADFFEQHFDKRLTRVIVTMRWNGTLQNGSALYMLNKPDEKDTSQESSHDLHNRPIPLPYRKKDSATHHTLIGYVTTGIYSLIRGQGHGIGYVLTDAILSNENREITPSGTQEVVVRKRNKRSLKPGKKIRLLCLNPNQSHYYHVQCTATAMNSQ